MMKMNEIPPASHYDSYPPLFRPESSPIHGGVVNQDHEPATTRHQDSDPLPEIDLQCLNHDDNYRLAEACKDWGIFRLVNHGIPMTILNQLHDHARELFSLPFESKQTRNSCSSTAMTYFWGTPGLNPAGVAIERGPHALNINWVEGFNVPLNQLAQELQAEHPVLDSFRLLLDEYGRHQSRLATTIFKAMAESLNLDQEQSKPYLSPSTGLIRVYRYPRCSDQLANQAWGMDAHTDSSVLSILNHGEVGGLQVHKDDKWLDVKPIPDTLIVNLGDMMQAMSDDRYKSVRHRVKANGYKERISVGYFVFPAEDGVIQSSKYKPFTYADFRAQVQEDLRTVGFKVGLDRFRLDEACFNY